MNKESKKLTWAVGLVAGLGVLSIAYAALSSTLYINGSGTVNAQTVEFYSCQAVCIGTNDMTMNSADGAELVTGTEQHGPFTEGDIDSNRAKAYGKAAVPFSSGAITSTATNSAAYDSSGSNIQIWRSSETSNHYADSLTIKGTELYDYGAYVIYKVGLKNYGPNAMKLTKVPVIKAYFTPAGGGTQGAADTIVKVSVHSDLTTAQNTTSGNTLAAFSTTATAAPSSDSANYLAANSSNEQFWYVKIQRLPQADTSPENEKIVNGTFEFTTNLGDTPAGGNVAVWQNGEFNS